MGSVNALLVNREQRALGEYGGAGGTAHENAMVAVARSSFDVRLPYFMFFTLACINVVDRVAETMGIWEKDVLTFFFSHALPLWYHSMEECVEGC